MTNVVFFLIFKADAKASVLRSKFQHQRVCNITFGGYIYIYILMIIVIFQLINVFFFNQHVKFDRKNILIVLLKVVTAVIFFFKQL